MTKDKYKHAMEIIENWERVETSYLEGAVWNKPGWEPGVTTLDALNNPQLYRIKREPRRVWVNYDTSGFPHAYEAREVAMVKCNFEYPEKAVEFVEVLK